MIVDPRFQRPSASALPRLSPCPGSWRLEREAVEQGMAEQTNEDAAKGSRIHEALTDSEVELASLGEKEIAQRIRRQMDFELEAWTPRQGFEIERERRMYWLEPRTVVACSDENLAAILAGGARLLFSGVPDFLAWKEELDDALILDGKTGRGAYEPADANAQLLGLAVLTYLRFPTLRSIRVGLIQPLVARASVAIYGAEMLEHAAKGLRALLSEVDTPDARIQMGRWCRYCRAKLICPEYTRARTQILAEPEPKDMIAQRAMSLSATQLDDLLDQRERLLWWAEAIAFEARARLQANHEQAPQRWHLKEGRRMRQLVKAGEAFTKLNSIGFTEDEILAVTSLSLPKIEERIAMMHGVSQKYAKRWAEELLGDLIEYTRAQPSLVQIKP